MVSGLQFSFVPLGATIANFSDTNSPTLARENKTFLEGRTSNVIIPIL